MPGIARRFPATLILVSVGMCWLGTFIVVNAIAIPYVRRSDGLLQMLCQVSASLLSCLTRCCVCLQLELYVLIVAGETLLVAGSPGVGSPTDVAISARMSSPTQLLFIFSRSLDCVVHHCHAGCVYATSKVCTGHLLEGRSCQN